jgi:uncharacterized protein
MQSAMQIELTNLKDGGGNFAHVYHPEELDLLDERVRLAGPASVNGVVRRTDDKVVVVGRAEAPARIECDRCLKPVELPVSTDFSVDYITGRDYESTNVVELTEDEMSLSVFAGDAIDLDEIVREQVLLAVPARALCQQDCKGICPTCGADRNAGACDCETSEIDPRWEALKKLVKQ